MTHYLGLDLGGTNVKCGVISDAGDVVAKVSLPTEAEQGPEKVVANMVAAAEQAAAEAGMALRDIAATGIGAPGPLDIANGILIAAPNLPGFDHEPLRDRIAEATGRPAVLENDANAAAFGEFTFGAGRGDVIRHLVMLTLGTGVGGGVIYDGRIIHGHATLAGELGHMIVQPHGRACPCGQHGCLEQYASASSVGRRVVEAIENGENSTLKGAFSGRLARITAKDVFEAAENGDDLSQRIVDETAEYLGIAIVSICRMLDPQMVVFAGGMILAGEFLFGRIREAYKKHTWTLAGTDVKIVTALLGNDAGIIGAASVAMDAAKTGDLK